MPALFIVLGILFLGMTIFDGCTSKKVPTPVPTPIPDPPLPADDCTFTDPCHNYRLIIGPDGKKNWVIYGDKNYKISSCRDVSNEKRVKQNSDNTYSTITSFNQATYMTCIVGLAKREAKTRQEIARITSQSYVSQIVDTNPAPVVTQPVNTENKTPTSVDEYTGVFEFINRKPGEYREWFTFKANSSESNKVKTNTFGVNFDGSKVSCGKPYYITIDSEPERLFCNVGRTYLKSGTPYTVSNRSDATLKLNNVSLEKSDTQKPDKEKIDSN